MKVALFAMIMWSANAFGAIDPHSIGWQPRIGQVLPMNDQWVDESGTVVRLSNLFGGKPAVIALGYFRCTGLCPLTFRGAAEAVRDAKLTGKDLEFLALSIDENESIADAREAKRRAGFDETSAVAHFLVGLNGAAMRSAESVGFNYKRDGDSSQFAHAAGIVVLTPEGRIANYLFGVRFPPEKLRAALVDAKRNSTAAITNPLLLLCYHLDPRTGKYTFAVLRVAQSVGIGTIAALMLLWWGQRT